MSKFTVCRGKILHIDCNKLKQFSLLDLSIHIRNTGRSVLQFCQRILLHTAGLTDNKQDQVCNRTDRTIHHNVSIDQLDIEKNCHCYRQHFDQPCHRRTDIFSISEITNDQQTKFYTHPCITNCIQRPTGINTIFHCKKAACLKIGKGQNNNRHQKGPNNRISNLTAFSLRDMFKHQMEQKECQNRSITHNGRVIQCIQNKTPFIRHLAQCHNRDNVHNNRKHRQPQTGQKAFLFKIQVHVLFIIKEQQYAIQNQRNIFYF